MYEETAAALTVVYIMVEVVESVVVANMVEMMAEAVEAVVAAHQFSIVMVPLLVGFSLKWLQLVQQQLR